MRSLIVFDWHERQMETIIALICEPLYRGAGMAYQYCGGIVGIDRMARLVFQKVKSDVWVGKGQAQTP